MAAMVAAGLDIVVLEVLYGGLEPVLSYMVAQQQRVLVGHMRWGTGKGALDVTE
jgi:hypothetical protein